MFDRERIVATYAIEVAADGGECASLQRIIAAATRHILGTRTKREAVGASGQHIVFYRSRATRRARIGQAHGVAAERAGEQGIMGNVADDTDVIRQFHCFDCGQDGIGNIGIGDIHHQTIVAATQRQRTAECGERAAVHAIVAAVAGDILRARA